MRHGYPQRHVGGTAYLTDGTLFTTVPLVNGPGSGVRPPPAAEWVRILDASGGVVAESPLIGQDG